MGSILKNKKRKLFSYAVAKTTSMDKDPSDLHLGNLGLTASYNGF